MSLQNKTAGRTAMRAGGEWITDFERNRITFPSGHNPFEIVVSAIEAATGKHARRSGNNVRLPCPSCGGNSYKVSIAEGDDQRAIVHCFGCNDTPAVLASVGLRLADLYPPRNWPESPQERQRARKAIQEAGWRSALEVLHLEACVVLSAARQLADWRVLSEEDDKRLAEAEQRIGSAKAVLTNGR